MNYLLQIVACDKITHTSNQDFQMPQHAECYPEQQKGTDHMSNIMLTYRCNLHCSYCFANEFVNKENTDITVRNFRKAVEFLTGSGETRIGLIGGEPTLHPVFQLLMEMLIANKKVTGITVYTNGLLMDRYIPQLVNPKVGALVNCNSPQIIGEKAFGTMQENLDTLILRYYMKDRINLGINLYSNEMDYSYIMDLLQRYKMHRVRISLTVPDFSACGNVDVLDYFRKRKQFMMKFFRDMDSIKVMPYFDCNYPPQCIWTEEEKAWLEAYTARYPEGESNLIGGYSRCNPVVDILPNLQAVRCFGMSDFMKVPISDFKNIRDLRRYFFGAIDSEAGRLAACEECRECYERKINTCYAGCIGFKASRIHACNEAVERL